MINKVITVFEHQTLKAGNFYNDIEFKDEHFSALSKFYGSGDRSYYKLVNKGVEFCEFVGALQVGNLLIEVLPKADTKAGGNTDTWRKLLVGMLRSVGSIDIHAPSSGSLKIKPNSMLDLYFNLFIQETEYLVHSGLIRKYRRNEDNVNVLKGSLHFPKHIQKNLVHKEKFFVRNNIFDYEHIWHVILYKTIKLIKQLTNSANLHNRIGELELLFPEMPDREITPKSFETLKYTRKTEKYRYAMGIARLLLMNYHPDIKHGHNDVLAIMFDMNRLWEKFVYVSLRNNIRDNTADLTIEKQCSRLFWTDSEDEDSYSNIRPDIVIKDQSGRTWVWDTKWKVSEKTKPASSDLMQMFAYSEYFGSEKAALVYPGVQFTSLSGHYPNPFAQAAYRKCSLICISAEDVENIWDWQKNIYACFVNWAEINQAMP